MPELARRILFSLVGAPLTIALIYAGGAVLATALSVVVALGAWELFRIARAGGSDPLDLAGVLAAAAVPLLVHAHYLGVYTVTWGVLAVAFITLMASAIWARGPLGRPLASVAVTLAGVLYPALLTFMYALRNHEYAIGAAAGTALAAFPIVLIWATDTGAYAVGRMAGRRKLMPSVSPSKTVEGAVGAIVVTALIAWAYTQLLLRPVAELALTSAGILLFAVAVGIAGQAGDLAESLLKREAKLKDSSRLLPGHGGILDRFDGQLFALPVAYVLLGWLLIPAPR